MEDYIQSRHRGVNDLLANMIEEVQKNGTQGHNVEEEMIQLRSYMANTLQKFLQV